MAFGVPTWIPGLLAFACGGTAYALMMYGEAKKTKQSEVPVTEVNGYYVCLYPHDPSIACASAAVALIFVAAVTANVFAGVPLCFRNFNVFANHHKIGVYVWFLIAWTGTIVAVVISSYAAWQQATHHRNSSQQINGPDGALPDGEFAYDYYATYEQTGNPKGVLCPTVKIGIFGGMGLVMLGNTMMWIAFLAMAATARDLFNNPIIEVKEFEPSPLEGAFVNAQHVPPTEFPAQGLR